MNRERRDPLPYFCPRRWKESGNSLLPISSFCAKVEFEKVESRNIIIFEFEVVNKSKMLVIFMVFATNEIEIELQSVNGHATC